MADIRVLPKELAELIAAGEVVDRPASVIKELTENAIDAGATKITVEIQRGGTTLMRVTDNGSGIRHEQVPTAFLRHATSKIKDKKDLFDIGTLGFRGEALASISAVSRVEMLTKTAVEDFGTRYVIEGGEEKEYSEAGCPEGTTIIVRDIFYNVPARMKFLKKDASESMAVAAVMDNLALSNPHIAIKFIKDSKTIISTNGDGKLHSVIYEVLGRDYAVSLLNVDAETKGIRVSGMTGKPINSRSTRSGQYFFLNGRVIRSGAAAKAVENAYKNTVMIGKFPICVLNIEVPYELVDVNVHPSKTEVRFTDESAVYEAVYYAVRAALVRSDERPELTFTAKKKEKEAPRPFARMTTQEYRELAQDKNTVAERLYKDVIDRPQSFQSNKTPIFSEPVRVEKLPPKEPEKPALEKEESFNYIDYLNKAQDLVQTEEKTVGATPFIPEEELEFKFIGEVYKTYIIVEFKGSIYFIDKHAAHERILFEKLKKERTIESQMLISPVSVTLSRDEHRAVCDNLDLLKKAGFEIEEFGNSAVLVRAVPSELTESDVMLIVCEAAESLLSAGRVENQRLENLYHTVACRAAIKGGNDQSALELEALAKQVLSNKDIMYCPHGRPVAFELKRSELEKQFGRIN